MELARLDLPLLYPRREMAGLSIQPITGKRCAITLVKYLDEA
jgi:hypothetical protein